METIRRNTFILLLLIGGLTLYAAPYTFRGLSVTNGLSDLLVNAIYKDAEGYVWLGTGNSLDRFDGIHVKHYAIGGTDEKLKRVNAVLEDAGRQLWMGNGSGLWKLDGADDRLEPVAADRIGCAVYALFASGDTLYAGTEKGLFVCRRGEVIGQVLPDKHTFSASNHVTGICADGNGCLWLATQNGLYAFRLSDGQLTAYHNVAGEKHHCAFNRIVCLDGMLYLGTMDRGILTFDILTSRFAPFVDVGCNVISSLSTDGNRLLYVGTDGNGVHFIDTARRQVVRSFRHEESDGTGGLRSNSVYSLLVDKEGIIWVGFYQCGLDYTLFQSNLFSVYSFQSRFDTKDMAVRALSISGSKKLIGTRDGLFFIDEEKQAVRSFKSPQMRSNMVFCIRFYRGRYYIGTYGGGMYVLDPASLRLDDFSTDFSLPFYRGHVFCLAESPAGTLWIGTSQGVYVYDGIRLVEHYTSANSQMPVGNVYEIYFDSTGKGWICTENGLCIWDPSSAALRADVFPKGFIEKEKIRVVYEDSRHTLYFFPDKGNMFISDLSMTRFHRLQPGTPIDGKDGLCLVEDTENHLWMGTSNGLFRYDKQGNFASYNFVDGIPSPVFTLCQPVCDADGGLWFGNTKGLVYLADGRLKQRHDRPYPMRVTDVLVNGSSVPGIFTDLPGEDSQIRLTASQRNVTFCISDFSYTYPGYQSYEYCLEGYDKSWQLLTGRSEVAYYDLSSGTYTFKVRLMGKPESEVRLAVEIAPPWWAWAASVCILLLLLTIVALRRLKGHGQDVPLPAGIPSVASVQSQPSYPVEVLGSVPDGKQEAAESGPEAGEKYKNFRLEQEESQRLTEGLERLMVEKKVYANPELKITDLAAMLHTSSHTLSYLFNQYLKRNYYDYINDYRVAEFKRLVKQGEYTRYTLNALSELCGFSSRASFFRYFKKSTGITPNEYIRRSETSKD